MTSLSEEEIRKLAAAWLPAHKKNSPLRIHTDTTEFFNVDYGDVVDLNERPYLIRHNAKEGRFGLDDEVKHWVKRAIDLTDGSHKFIKLVFHERFKSRIGNIEFECFRSPRKEARILDLVRGRDNFMQGNWVEDEKGNIVRILDHIQGPPLSKYIQNLAMDHESYFHDAFPEIFDGFLACARAIHFLHEHGEKHGDIRRDHILIDRESGHYRWIDFDFNYRHRENIHGYDLFGLGNVLAYLVGKGDILVQDLAAQNHPALDRLSDNDRNIVFHHRIMNLKRVFAYVPEPLNMVLLHFSKGANRFYHTTQELLEDLESYKNA
jgi:hypothetical protein